MTYRVIGSDGTHKSFTDGLMARGLANRLRQQGHVVIFERFSRGYGWIAV